MITICFTYFKSLTLANLQAALYSVRRQDFTSVSEVVIIDNNTDDDPRAIEKVVGDLGFPVPVFVHSIKHGDETKTHAWSSNLAVLSAITPWVLLTRADYLLDFSLVARFKAVIDERPADWNGFVTGHVYHLGSNLAACEQTAWREQGTAVLHTLPGSEADYTKIDAGVWMARQTAYQDVRGLDERLTAWGHAQTHFQWKMDCAGVEFVKIPEVLFYHPQHNGARDLGVSHQQLLDSGISLKELWSRYDGVQPYQ